MLLEEFPDVLCFWCLQKPGLSIHAEFVPQDTAEGRSGRNQITFAVKVVPVLKCSRCDERKVGRWDNGDAVFPDHHVTQETGQTSH